MPNSTLRLLKLPRLDADFHTLYFPGNTKQSIFNYMASKTVYTFTNNQYRRVDDTTINVSGEYGMLSLCNYMMIQNPGENTLYYAVTSCNYLNENTVQLTIKLNPFYTYWGDLTILPSFIEREITNTDNLFEHTIDEGLSAGDRDLPFTTTIKAFPPDYIYAICTHFSGAEEREPGLRHYGKVMSYAPVLHGYYNNATNLAFIENLLSDLAPEDILAVGLHPRICDKAGDLANGMDGFDEVMTETATINLNVNGLNGYVPKNKKMFNSPFCFIKLSNFTGDTKILKPECFNGTTASFKFIGNLVPSPSVVGYPKNYDGLADNYFQSVSITNYPQIPHGGDLLKADIIRNKGKLIGTAVGSAVAIGAGLATGAVPLTAMGVANMVGNTASTIGTYADESRRYNINMPKIDGIITQLNLFNISIQQWTIDAEQAKSIDDYFSMYGYKVNSIKIPDFMKDNHRQNHGYCKGDIQFLGNIPNSAKEELISLFRDGITFWYRDDDTNLLDPNPVRS